MYKAYRIVWSETKHGLSYYLEAIEFNPNWPWVQVGQNLVFNDLNGRYLAVLTEAQL